MNNRTTPARAQTIGAGGIAEALSSSINAIVQAIISLITSIFDMVAQILSGVSLTLT